jgi:hypothetical protein
MRRDRPTDCERDCTEGRVHVQGFFLCHYELKKKGQTHKSEMHVQIFFYVTIS